MAVAKSAVPGEYYVYEAPDAVTFQAMANRIRAAFTYLKKPWPRICKVTVNGRAAAGVLILRRKVSLEQYPQQPLATQPPKPPAKADR